MKPIKERCGAVHGFYVCELQPGHTCRHREDRFTWIDAAVIAARANAELAIDLFEMMGTNNAIATGRATVADFQQKVFLRNRQRPTAANKATEE